MTATTDNDSARVEAALARHDRSRDSLIPLLQAVQNSMGYLSEDAIGRIAAHLSVSEAEVYGVATFYAQFSFRPPGRHMIRVCRGTACHVKGSMGILESIERRLGIRPGETTADRKFSLVSVACFGSCALSPAVMIDDRVHGRMTSEKVEALLKELA